MLKLLLAGVILVPLMAMPPEAEAGKRKRGRGPGGGGFVHVPIPRNRCTVKRPCSRMPELPFFPGEVIPMLRGR